MLINENQPMKIKFFVSSNFLSEILISKMGVKMNLIMITKNHAADSVIGFLTKSISNPCGRTTATPTALDLNLNYMISQYFFSILNFFAIINFELVL